MAHIGVGRAAIPRSSAPSGSLEHERDFEDDFVTSHFAVIYRHFLVFDPRPLDILQRLIGPCDALDNRVLKALRTDAAYLGDTSDCHR